MTIKYLVQSRADNLTNLSTVLVYASQQVEGEDYTEHLHS